MLEPPLPDERAALFLDFDGTLAEIAEHPGAVSVEPELPALLAALQRRLGGAVAILSGRPIAELDDYLAPLRLPAAGVHGAQRRGPDGGAVAVASAVDLTPALHRLGALAATHPALLVEPKPGAVALHFRRDPALEPLALREMRALRDALPGMVLQPGKMVLELKPAGARKDLALRAFMAEAPFAGRRPWFFGDDVTDEDGFQAVAELGGVGVKIGTGRSGASHRLDDVVALRDWLARAARALPPATAVAGPTEDTR